MSYIENIFVCIAAPLLIAIICISSRGRRPLLFVLGGMTMCLLSSYISTFVAAVQGADLVTASLEITPLVEEIMKLLPFLFYMLVFEPGRHTVLDSLLMTAIGFATFENICYLSQNGAENFFYLLIRGFGTGAMHVICEAFIGLGILYLWDRKLIQVAGTVGLLAIAITFHGIYNILVSQTGIPARIGYIMPLITTLFVAFYGNRHAR